MLLPSNDVAYVKTRPHEIPSATNYCTIIPSKFTVSESQDEVTNFRMGRVWKNGTNGKSVEKWNENTGQQLDRFERTDGSSRLPNLLTW